MQMSTPMHPSRGWYHDTGSVICEPTRDPHATLYLALLHWARSGSRPQTLTLSVTHFHFIICLFYPLVRIISCQPKPTRRHSLALQSRRILCHWKKRRGKSYVTQNATIWKLHTEIISSFQRFEFVFHKGYIMKTVQDFYKFKIIIITRITINS